MLAFSPSLVRLMRAKSKLRWSGPLRIFLPEFPKIVPLILARRQQGKAVYAARIGNVSERLSRSVVAQDDGRIGRYGPRWVEDRAG